LAEVSEEALDRLFHALADTTRRRLLAQLALGPAKVTDLARPFQMSLPAVSKHLRILEEAGLASRTIDGRVHRLRLTGGPLEAAETWLDPFRSFWDQSFRDLRRDLELHPPRRTSRGARRTAHAPRDRASDEVSESPDTERPADDSTP
jgi:DNA-binding transcriptional ArsR family regulator